MPMVQTEPRFGLKYYLAVLLTVSPASGLSRFCHSLIPLEGSVPIERSRARFLLPVLLFFVLRVPGSSTLLS